MPCAADERSARFGTMRAFHIADMKKIRERISFTDLELMTRLELVTSSLPTALDAQKCY